MGIFLIVTVLVIIVGIIATIINYGIHGFTKYLISTIGTVALILYTLYFLAGTLSIIKSYTDYLEARSMYDSIINQYEGAVSLYTDKAVLIDVKKAALSCLTDIRYQGYQEQLGEFVKDLRTKITQYNNFYIKKKILDRNFFFSWYVINVDGDMKLMQITESNF